MKICRVRVSISLWYVLFSSWYKNLPFPPFSNFLQAGADSLLSKLRHPEIMEIFSGLHGEKLGPIISKKFKTILVSCLVFLPALLLVLWMRRSTFDLVVEFSESIVQGKVHNVTEIDVGKTIFCSIILLHLSLCYPLIK